MEANQLKRIKEENVRLRDELTQCEKDKDFVWSLWKRLQVSNPDVTSAVSLAIKREKDKSEEKDERVLRILESKDRQIEELEEINRCLTDDITSSAEERNQLRDDCRRLEEENVLITEKVHRVDVLIQEREKSHRTSDDVTRRRISDIEMDRDDLRQRLEKSLKETKSLKEESSTLRDKVSKLESHIRTIEVDLKETSAHLERVQAQYRRASEKLTEYEADIKEVQKLKKENADLSVSYESAKVQTRKQNELISQLQALQSDTETVMRSQEQAYGHEKMTREELENKLVDLQLSERRCRDQLTRIEEEYKEELQYRDQKLEKLEKRLGDKKVVADSHAKLSSLEAEVDTLRERLMEKNRIIRSLEVNSSLKPRTSSKRSQSLSPERGARVDAARKLSTAERKISDLQRRLRLKDNEMDELKKAHDRRLIRYNNLREESHRLTRELELFASNPPAPALNEDNDHVWSKLSQFEAKVRSLTEDKVALQESMDCLRIERSRDQATIDDMRAALDEALGEKGELDEHIKARRKLERECVKVKSDLEAALKDKLALAKELNTCRHELNNLRENVPVSDIGASKAKPQKKLIAGKMGSSSQKASSSSNPLLAKRQAFLNQSIAKMNKLFLKESEDHDWEDAEEESCSSLGQKIVCKAQQKPVRNSKTRRSMQSTSSVQTDIDSSNIPTLAHLINLVSESELPTPRIATMPVDVGKLSKAKKNKSNSEMNGILKKKNVSLQERVEMLTEQNLALRDAKETLQKRIDSLETTNNQLRSDVSSINMRLRSIKGKEQKLSNDNEVLQREKIFLEKQLQSSPSVSTLTLRSDSDSKGNESRLKVAQAETSRQKEVAKKLTDDLTLKDDEIKTLKEKVNRLERDLVQKRSLIEGLRAKIKSEETKHNESSLQEDLEMQIQTLKSQQDSSKRTIENLRKEVQRYKDMYSLSALEVEKKDSRLRTLSTRKTEAENFANELEAVANEQLSGLACQSESAIDALQNQLRDAGVIVKEFISFVRAFSREVWSRVMQDNRMLESKQGSPGMQVACSKAASILNLSQEDIQDIISSTSSGVMKVQNEAWNARCEKILNSKAPFASDLISIMLELFEIFSQIKSSLYESNSS